MTQIERRTRRDSSIRTIALLLTGAFCLLTQQASPEDVPAAGPDWQTLGAAYGESVQPHIERYCHACHDADRSEADIDLSAFGTLESVRTAPRVWQRVLEMLDSRQMPPRKARQPDEQTREHIAGWVRQYLSAESRSLAGDPGPTVLRRLSNAEYRYTIRDLTGVDSLDPVREFPVDGAAGEGFTNTGEALVMSPALLSKYLEAAKGIADHVVFLPRGLRFSKYDTAADHADEALRRIQSFYRRYTEPRPGTFKDWRGRDESDEAPSAIPLASYLAATFALRDREPKDLDAATLRRFAEERGLSSKYLSTLWNLFTNDAQQGSSFLLAHARVLWRQSDADDHRELLEFIRSWQDALWNFRPIGHLGRDGGPTSWQAAQDPLVESHELRLEIPEALDSAENSEDISVWLTSHALLGNGESRASDALIWVRPRLEGGGEAPLLLRDARSFADQRASMARELLESSADYLSACASVDEGVDLDKLAESRGLDAELLRVWADWIGRRPRRAVEVSGHFTEMVSDAGGYDFVDGWGSGATPSIVANSSDREVRIPGIAGAHSIVVHPSPTLYAAVAWQSSIDAEVRVEASIRDAHPECGNGVEWRLFHRGLKTTSELWRGEVEQGGRADLAARTLHVRRGELIELAVGPRAGSHVCDLSAVDLSIRESGGRGRTWDLAADVSPDILAGNPHADRHGNERVWHLYKGEWSSLEEERKPRDAVPAGSLLAHWREADDAGTRAALAEKIRALATGTLPNDASAADAQLHSRLRRLWLRIDPAAVLKRVEPDPRFIAEPSKTSGSKAGDLVTDCQASVEFRLPAELLRGRTLVADVRLDPKRGQDSCAQVTVGFHRPKPAEIDAARSLLAVPGSAHAQRIEDDLEAFRTLFPKALCYSRIVPVDEVVTLVLYHREDEHLARLMLENSESAQLDKLWDELRTIRREPLEFLVAYEQISEFATQDRPDLVVALRAVRAPAEERARKFREQLLDSEPSHLEAIVQFAHRAWRRPLSEGEQADLRTLYTELRRTGLAHEPSARLTMARVLTSPAFLYRIEQVPPSASQAPVTALELATRLSYFLHASTPDERLRRMADSGALLEERALLSETRRLLRHPRARRLAIHFFCQWLDLRDFDRNDEKNERLYPDFAALRTDMYEEAVRFFETLIREDRSVLELLDADYCFVNDALAAHYGLPLSGNAEWRRVESVRARGRGGVLTLAASLAKNSGASRTSPILRGNWVYERLLGKRLPRPPPNVPQLPDTLPEGATARELIEQHSSAPECAECHVLIDPFGFALEQYDAIGRIRPQPADTRSRLLDGRTLEGVDDLRHYLTGPRRRDFVRQFCRKLLGYALGRGLQLSDDALIDGMVRRLESEDYRFGAAVEALVISRPFRELRGGDWSADD